MSKYIDTNNLGLYNHDPKYEKKGILFPPVAFIKGIYSMLCSNIQGKFLDSGWQVKVSADNSQNQEDFCCIQATLHQWSFSSLSHSYLLAIAGIIDSIFLVKNKSRISQKSEGKRVNLATKFYDNWWLFLNHLQLSLDRTPPYSCNTLHQLIKKDELYINLFEELIASLQTYLSESIQPNISIVENIPFNPLWEKNFSDPHFLVSCFNVTSNTTNPTIQRIERAISRGSSVLLIGNTGVGKTEMAKAACLSQGAKLVKINAHPGLDDKALYGGIYPDGKGSFAYILGFLSESFNYASGGNKTVLLIDEIARFDPYYIAILIGAFDELSGSEIKARPNVINHLKDTVIDVRERYYLLCLPNGTYRITPITNLCIIGTTNLGKDYQQAIQTLDPALMRRFKVHIDCKHLDNDAQVNILINRLDIPQNVAETMVKLADFSRANTAAQGGLLRQEANLGILFNWGEEAKSLFAEEGYLWLDSLLEASHYTIIPFIVGRGSNGYLEAPAVDMVLDELKRIILSTFS